MSFDRRSMLRSAAATAGVLALGCEDKPAADSAPPAPAQDPEPQKRPTRRGVAPPVLDVLTAVAERILPSGGEGPGAKEADVRGFLDKTLADARVRNLVPMLNRGAGFLNRAAQSEHQKQRFADLTPAQQDDLLERLGGNKMRPDRLSGPAFMRVMVALTLEGYLGDPAHGGNKDQVAWQWLGFHPDGRAAVFANAKGG